MKKVISRPYNVILVERLLSAGESPAKLEDGELHTESNHGKEYSSKYDNEDATDVVDIYSSRVVVLISANLNEK